jgi:hypothetical protein
MLTLEWVKTNGKLLDDPEVFNFKKDSLPVFVCAGIGYICLNAKDVRSYAQDTGMWFKVSKNRLIRGLKYRD